MQIIIIFLLLINIFFSQTSIKIYNQGWTFVQEEREHKFTKIDKQTLHIDKLPESIEPTSINLFSKDIEFISKEYIYNPITINSLLNINIGNKIELVKYDDNGSIIYKTTGKLISNRTNNRVFEINNKIIINPPYEFIFSNIPNSIKNYPYLNCIINNSSKKSNYKLSYFIHGMNWEVEFNLYLLSNGTAEIEGWYSIINNNNYSYKNINISLLSGDVNFELQNPKQSTNTNFNRQPLSAKTMSVNSIQPQINQTEDYFIFQIPEKINLSATSRIQYKFLYKQNVQYDYYYHASHKLSRYKTNEAEQNIPINTQIEFPASNVGNFQLPQGNYSVYESNNNDLTFIGSNSHSIASKSDTIRLEIGKTHDIKCKLKVKSIEENNKKIDAQINIKFNNQKDQAINLKWIEEFPYPNWNITNCKYNFIKIDAHRAEFNILIPSNSNKILDFTASIIKPYK